MALDPRFVVSSDLEELFRDSLSGLPLSAGRVEFYSDDSRSALKSVYQLTGDPPNYSYAPLPNPCYLSSVGTFQDGAGNNIVPYYYPYVGLPEDNSATQELYFIKVYSSDNRLIFTRQGWPNNAGTSSNASAATNKNFIPNGQFLAHNNGSSAQRVTNVANYTAGGNVDVTYIAQGGWSLKISSGSTSTFDNSFIFNPFPGSDDLPLYAFVYKCTSYDGVSQVRDLVIEWPDVNKFCAAYPDVGTQDYNLFFRTQSNDGATASFDVYLIYSYGTGGSPPTETKLTTISVTNSIAVHNVSIGGFPVGAGTISSVGDDYVALALRPAVGQGTFNSKFTDFALTAGSAQLNIAPVQTNAEMLADGVAGWMPKPDSDGQDLYLPLILTSKGMTFDRSEIGKVNASFYTTPINNELLCDGQAVLGNGYSSLGIPYSRLRDKFIADSPVANLPMFGTGANYANSYIYSSSANSIRITSNSAGLGTAAASTFPTFVATRDVAGYAANASWSYNGAANSVLLVNVTSAAPDTSGFTFTLFNFETGYFAQQYIAYNIVCTTAAALVAGVGVPGKYFSMVVGGVTYIFWYYLNGEIAPGAAGTKVKISLPSSGLSAQDVANITREALNGFEVNSISLANVPNAGEYFTFTAGGQLYGVWCQLGGLPTTAPVIGGSPIYIKVELTLAETLGSAASKIQAAMNRYQYAVPDLRGLFLRGNDPTNIWDTDGRVSSLTTLSGHAVGMLEYGQLLNHIHNVTSVVGRNSAATGTSYCSATNGAETLGAGVLNITHTGGSETRPVNFSVNYFIKY